MELTRDSVYLYDFVNYDKLVIDLEILTDMNPDYTISLLSRLPTRRWIEKIDLAKIANFWISNSGSDNAVIPDIDAIIKIVNNSSPESSNLYVLDGLEQIYAESDKAMLLEKLSILTDLIKGGNNVLIICLDQLSFDSDWIARLRHITEKLTIQHRTFEAIVEDDTVAEVPEDHELVYELGIDGGPRLAYLSKLPSVGFTREILVKRILQWRRMGLDVSAIEPALHYPSEDAYNLYKMVEENVRRATELERFIHANKSLLDVSQISTDMFRLRQLTGLDELEKKYYSLSG